MPKLVEISPHTWLFQHDHPESIDDMLDSALEMLEVGKLAEAEQVLRDLLFVHPEHMDALHHMALLYAQTGRRLESYLCTREAVRLGLAAIPPAFSWLTSRMYWEHLENRPFIRAYHTFGLALHHEGRSTEALEIFARLESINPEDNLGVRYLLMQSYLDTADWQAALAVSQRYPNDAGPDIAYSRAIALVQLGQNEEALECLKTAIYHSPSVARELLKPKHVRPKAELPGYMLLGGEEQAFDYWERNRVHWAKNTEVFKLLKMVFT